MSPSPASISAFPIIEILEALDGWQREPGPDRRGAVASALEGVIRMAGVEGAILEVSAEPLMPLSVAAGDLVARAGDPDTSGLAIHELASSKAERPLGRLLLDAAATSTARDVTARSIGLAVDAAWSRAVVHAQVGQLAALEIGDPRGGRRAGHRPRPAADRGPGP